MFRVKSLGLRVHYAYANEDQWCGFPGVDDIVYNHADRVFREAQDRFSPRVFFNITHITECIILDEQGNEVGYGVAYCNRLDHFSKKTGRKLAFSRAVLSPLVAKADRRQLWEAFFASEGLPYGTRTEGSEKHEGSRAAA